MFLPVGRQVYVVQNRYTFLNLQLLFSITPVTNPNFNTYVNGNLAGSDRYGERGRPGHMG